MGGSARPARLLCEVGDPKPAGWSSTVLLEPLTPLALPCSLQRGMAQHTGHTGWHAHGSSVAERESIGCVSLTPSPFPTSTKADLALGPKDTGLG